MFKVLLLCFISFGLIQDEPTISWNAHQRVTWNDFKSEPKPHSDVIAVTASGLSFGYSTTKFSTGRIEYDFEVTAHFYPERSWYVKKDATERTLAHERLHFDITELHARKFRKRVRTTRFSKQIDKEMDAINNEVNEALRNMQRLYDSETSHSRNAEKQIVWQKYVEQELQKMVSYRE